MRVFAEGSRLHVTISKRLRIVNYMLFAVEIEMLLPAFCDIELYETPSISVGCVVAVHILVNILFV